MNDILIASFDFIAFLSVVTAFLFWPRWKNVFTKNTRLLFVLILILFGFNHLSNTLEWLGITSAFDAAEDNVELLVPLFWGFAIFAYIQDRSLLELKQAYATTLESWTQALELKDKPTEGHSRRTTELSLRMAERLGLDESAKDNIKNGALLHDIGKVGIPDNILSKPASLTHEERSIVEQHPTTAYSILRDNDYLSGAIDIPFCHHENWDGSGYPRKLKGEQIPISARIFSIVDNWDALGSDRPYRKAWSREQMIDYIRAEAGKKFDPALVDVFLELIEAD